MKETGRKRLERLKESARELVHRNGGVRKNGAKASIRTKELTMEVLMAVCERLWHMGYQIRDIADLRETHVRALLHDWHANGFAPKTIQNHLSRLRRVCAWIGRPHIIPKGFAQKVLPHADLTVSAIAKKSKSWSEHGIDVLEKIHEADRIDQRFGAMLRLGLAFGLRRKEQLRIKPWQADTGRFLILRANVAKSGKDRDVEIHHPFQRVCLNHAKRLVGKGGHLGWEGKTYAQNIQRYNYLMRKLGITGKDTDCVGHGLRAEYAENISLLHGLIPPVLGGSIDQMDEKSREQIRMMVSESMGHHRPEVTSAYYGSFRPQKPKPGN